MASEFCPQCGNPRVGSFKFCRSCGFDFDGPSPTAPTASVSPGAPPSQAAPPTAPPISSAPRASTNLPLIGGLAWIGCAALIGYLAYQQWVLGRAFAAEDYTANAIWNLVSAVVTLYFGVRLLQQPSRETLKRSAFWAIVTVLWGVYQVAALDVTSDIFVLSLIAAAVAGVTSWVARNQLEPGAATAAVPSPAVATSTAMPVPASPPLPPGVTTPPKSSGIGMAEVGVVGLIVLALGAGALVLAKQNSDRILADVASLIPTVRPTVRVTAPPVGQTGEVVGFGEAIDLVTADNEDLGSVTIVEGVSPTELLGSGPRSGQRYVAARVRYAATQPWTYTLFDWTVHDSGQSQYEPLGYAPEPMLSGGTVAPGKSVEGWVAFEIPRDEEAWLDLQASDGTIIFSVEMP